MNNSHNNKPQEKQVAGEHNHTCINGTINYVLTIIDMLQIKTILSSAAY